MCVCDLGRLLHRLDACRHRWAAARGIEQRQLVGAEAEQRDPQALEELDRRGHVEERLDPCRDDESLGTRKLAEISGDVRRVRPATVDTAEPAGTQEANAGAATDGERAADGGRADAALHRARCEVAGTNLARGRVEPRELVAGQTDADLPVQNSDRRGDCTCLAHRSLRVEADRDAVSVGEAVRDEGRLERDDGARLAYLVRDDDHGIAPSFATHRAAVSTASSGPATMKPAASASPAPVASTTSP